MRRRGPTDEVGGVAVALPDNTVRQIKNKKTWREGRREEVDGLALALLHDAVYLVGLDSG